MTRKDKVRFIRDLTKNVCKNIEALVPEMPEDFDGKELRVILSRAFRDANFGPLYPDRKRALNRWHRSGDSRKPNVYPEDRVRL